MIFELVGELNPAWVFLLLLNRFDYQPNIRELLLKVLQVKPEDRMDLLRLPGVMGLVVSKESRRRWRTRKLRMFARLTGLRHVRIPI